MISIELMDFDLRCSVLFLVELSITVDIVFIVKCRVLYNFINHRVHIVITYTRGYGLQTLSYNGVG